MNELVFTKSQLNGSLFLSAHLAQKLKHALKSGINYPNLSQAQQEALEQLMTHLSHILSGNMNYINHWQDMADIILEVVDELRQIPCGITSTTTYAKVDSSLPF